MITLSRAEGIRLDPFTLAETRGLFQASSGGGKSHLLRLIAEQAADQMPVIVIDPEGEFFTVREVAGMVLVGKSGEIPCQPGTAAKVARGLLEQSCSAIIDLSDLPHSEHKPYVAEFLRSVMSAPRRLWRPTLFAIDEAHRFCQEGLRSDECAAEVIDLMSRGRKRKFGGVLLTQRISKVRKDAIAEAANVFVGRVTLDQDIKRSADTLGRSVAECQGLRSMKAGAWVGFGPALSETGVVEFRADLPQTEPPKDGGTTVPPVASADAIAEIAAHVAETASGTIATLEEAEAEIARLQSELRGQPDPGITESDAKLMVAEAVDAAEQRWSEAIDKSLAHIREGAESLEMAKFLSDYGLNRVASRADEAAIGTARTAGDAPSGGARPAAGTVNGRATRHEAASGASRDSSPKTTSRSAPGRVLEALAWWAAVGVLAPTLQQVAVVAGYSPNASTVRNARTALKADGLIQFEPSGCSRMTESGRARAPKVSTPSLREWHDRLFDLIGKENARGIVFRSLLGLSGRKRSEVSIDALSENTGYSADASTIRNALTDLRKLGLITKRSPIRLTDLAFPEGLK